MPVEQLSCVSGGGIPKVANQFRGWLDLGSFKTYVAWGLLRASNSVYLGLVYVKYHSWRLN